MGAEKSGVGAVSIRRREAVVGDRAPSQIGGVIPECLKGNRCVAATQAYRCALPELRLASLHRSSAFQSDRQRIQMRHPAVRPNPNIDPNIDLWP
jgi:hypothetical protein